jgi:hypothetical protein
MWSTRLADCVNFQSGSLELGDPPFMLQLGEELPWKGGSSFDGEYTGRISLFEGISSTLFLCAVTR